MKEKMLLPVRRSAGLEDNFYYNNCPESMNSCMKKEIDHQKKAASPGRSSKCSYAEFSDISDTFVGKYRRNAQGAEESCLTVMLAQFIAQIDLVIQNNERD